MNGILEMLAHKHDEFVKDQLKAARHKAKRGKGGLFRTELSRRRKKRRFEG